MSQQEFENYINTHGIKKGDLLYLKWKTGERSTAACVSRLNEIVYNDKGNIEIKFAYFVHPWSLDSFITIRKATFYDKVFNKYWGTFLDNSPF